MEEIEVFEEEEIKIACLIILSKKEMKEEVVPLKKEVEEDMKMENNSMEAGEDMEK